MLTCGRLGKLRRSVLSGLKRGLLRGSCDGVGNNRLSLRLGNAVLHSNAGFLRYRRVTKLLLVLVNLLSLRGDREFRLFILGVLQSRRRRGPTVLCDTNERMPELIPDNLRNDDAKYVEPFLIISLSLS